MQISYHPIITEKCEKKRFLLKFHKCRPAQVSLLPAFGREMPQNRWKYPGGSVTIKMYECALSVTCGDRLPLLSLRDIFPRRGGSLSSKGEPLAWRYSFRLNCKVCGFARASPFGRGGIASAMTERASPLPGSVFRPKFHVLGRKSQTIKQSAQKGGAKFGGDAFDRS